MKPKTQVKFTKRDYLALERTKLANERTFLAYFRTSVVFLGTGVSVLKIEFFADIKQFGWLLVGLSPLLLAIGIARLVYVRRRIRNEYYKEEED